MKGTYGFGKPQPNLSETIPFTQTNERKTTPLNTRAIKLYDFLEIFGLEADKSVTNISTNLYINKQSGKIKEGNEHLKGEMTEFSAFLGIMNIMGANFLVFVKEVAVHFVLDGSEKIFEISSVEFIELLNPQDNSKITKEIKEFISQIEQILSSGGFYFSYKYPLTLSQQKIFEQTLKLNEKQQGEQAVQKLVDYDYMWNQQLMKTLLQQRVSSDWQVQLIQGHVYNLIIYTPNITYFTLISRRQTRRAGTRFNHRGINSDGFVANCVETEQILVIPSIQRVISQVQIRGSIPCFWKQTGATSKVVIDPSKPLQSQACKLHLDYLVKNYNQTTCVNLMSNSNHNEKKLSDEFQYLLNKDIREEVHYKEFDFHQEVKGDKLENVDMFIENSGLLRNIMDFGYFSRDFLGQALTKQLGIVRTNCLDCLDRTNFFQLRVGFLALRELILSHLKLFFKPGTEDKFLKDFQTCWSENGDKISWHYAGTDSTTSTVTKTGKQSVFGFLKGKISSAKRFIQGALNDSNKQQCYCFLLGEHYETQENLVFQEELQKLMKLKEDQFTKKRKITIFAVTWNVGTYVPDKITQKFPTLFWHNQKNDIVVIAYQELVELKPKNLMMSTLEKHNAQKEWQEIIQNNLGNEYFPVTSLNMVGLQTYIFARTELKGCISDVETDIVKCGFGGQLGNKGSVAIRFSIDDTSFVFLNCHLPAGQSKVVDRVNSLYQCINQSFQQEGMSNQKKDPLMRTDKIIVLGDMNFRIERKRADAMSAIERILSLRKDFEYEQAQSVMEDQVSQFDQLQILFKGVQSGGTFSQNSIESLTSISEKDINNGASQQRSSGIQSCLDACPSGKTGCLRVFYEKKIKFLPTYKFDVNTDVYDTSKKQRVPSYCDRILICDNENENRCIEDCYLVYESCPSLSHSDHKPVFALLQFSAKKINCEAREQVEEEIIKAQENAEEVDCIEEEGEEQSSVQSGDCKNKDEIEKLKSELLDFDENENEIVSHEDLLQKEEERLGVHKIVPVLPGTASGDSDPLELLSQGNITDQQKQPPQTSNKENSKFSNSAIVDLNTGIANFKKDKDRDNYEQQTDEYINNPYQSFKNTVYQENKGFNEGSQYYLAQQKTSSPHKSQIFQSQPQIQSLGFSKQALISPSLSFLSAPPVPKEFSSDPFLPVLSKNTSENPNHNQPLCLALKEHNNFIPSQIGSPGSNSFDVPQIPYQHEKQHHERNQLTHNNNTSFHFQSQKQQQD